MKSKKILLLTAPIGSGHKKAAEAVQEAIRGIDASCTVKIIDVFDFLPKAAVSFCLKLYFKILNHMPCVYGGAYDWGKRSRIALMGRNTLSFCLSFGLKRMMDDFSPDAIVCTHASAASGVDYVLKKRKTYLYHAGIITDFAVHRLWVNESIDDYFIYDEQILDDTVKPLIAPRKIQVMGIPVAKQFVQYTGDGAYHFSDERKTILLMGGGDGLMPLDILLTALNEVNTPLRLVILTGHNRQLKMKLENMREMFKHQLYIEDFVDNVADFMKIADILISKAGGISMNEALCMGLPLLIYHPLPGQEQANTQFLVKRNVAVEIKTINDFPREIDKIFRNPDEYKRWKMRLYQIAKPWAAENIAKNILNKLYN